MQKIPLQLIRTVKKVAKEKADFLDNLKKESKHLSRNDFVWHFLLSSFATMGKSKGWDGLIGNSENYSKLNFELLLQIPVKERQDYIETVCRNAKIRMPSIKAKYIFKCHQQIVDLGGLKKTKNMLLKEIGREAKINFLKCFSGIGDKYARNIMMDVYHEDFRQSIAVDLRIQAISKSWGLVFLTYHDHEDFYLALAKKTNLNGWELDRLMYNFKDSFCIGDLNKKTG